MVLVATQVKRRRGTTAENDAFTGAEGEITVDTEKHELRVHDGITLGGFKIGGGSGAMPVGAIFTTPRTGTIQGAVEANGNPYNIADYSGEGSIGALLTAGSIAYVSKAEFQTQVTNTGACDSFGWDGTSDTTFLVPKLNPWHVGKSAPVVGNGTTLGLTNGKNQYGLGSRNNDGHLLPVSDLYNTATGTNSSSTSGVNTASINSKGIGLTTDPTKSGMIADLSETTNLRVMVQLATGATDQALETCTSVLADVAGLKDMSNITPTGKETVVGWGIPDYSAGVQITSSSYTAPTAGFVFANGSLTSWATALMYVNDKQVDQFRNVYNDANAQYGVQCVLGKGDVVSITGGKKTPTIRFYPFKGVN